ncbi:hypothetical protein B0H17DRAFT_1133298 [Mycena rosella]|uniref:Uncharacterized protein n=1 Tax=Mycena rosella TaxID=1033263 RepID=A0AAD7DIQ6_MYCRO|nr:hypothetical protein B0H17DRAFT_1133298 [Mycena rosella]
MSRSTMPSQLTLRLFGPSNSPDGKMNACHRTLLRKRLELFTPEVLQAVFTKTNRLRLAMGAGINANQFGKILTNFVDRNGRLVSTETDTPDTTSRQALAAYRIMCDQCFKKQGHDFVIRSPSALHALQAAEQAWHDYIVPYHAARGMGARPKWALEVLPGLEQVRCPGSVHPTCASLVQSARESTNKRKREPVIELSNSEEECPHKKTKARKSLGSVDLTKDYKFLGVIDLTK